MELYARHTARLCEHLQRVAGHTHWEIFFWRRGISFRFGPFVFLLMEAIFSFNFWKAASIKPKMASFLGSNFGFEFGAKTCLFWSLWQIIPAWLVLEAAGCEQSELSLLCCGSTSMIPAAKL